jgi:hypothetical protein
MFLPWAIQCCLVQRWQSKLIILTPPVGKTTNIMYKEVLLKTVIRNNVTIFNPDGITFLDVNTYL